MRAGLPLLITAATVVVLAGCGGGSTSEPAAAVGAEFAAKALAVCEAALNDRQGWAAFPIPASDFDPNKPDTAKFPQVSAWLEEQVAPTFHTWLDDLKALGTPSSAPEAWNSMLVVVAKIAQLNDDQIAAAKDGDADAFAAATSALIATQDDLVSTSAAAGVPACADVHAA
jgi:hypothetical protein